MLKMGLSSDHSIMKTAKELTLQLQQMMSQLRLVNEEKNAKNSQYFMLYNRLPALVPSTSVCIIRCEPWLSHFTVSICFTALAFEQDFSFCFRH